MIFQITIFNTKGIRLNNDKNRKPNNYKIVSKK